MLIHRAADAGWVMINLIFQPVLSSTRQVASNLVQQGSRQKSCTRYPMLMYHIAHRQQGLHQLHEAF